MPPAPCYHEFIISELETKSLLVIMWARLGWLGREVEVPEGLRILSIFGMGSCDGFNVLEAMDPLYEMEFLM